MLFSFKNYVVTSFLSCRWMIYKGKRLVLADLITRPKNSIINQAHHLQTYTPGCVYKCSEEGSARNNSINADGFGICWYDCDDRALDIPAVFKSTTPAWSNQNLFELAQVVYSTRTSF